MTLTFMRCPSCHGKSIEAQRTSTIHCGAPWTLYHCSSCAWSFSETRHTPIAQLKTPIALVVQVLAALTEGVGINEQSPQSTRRNALPVKLIDGSLVMGHKYLACALV
jgi:transposase-like protein